MAKKIRRKIVRPSDLSLAEPEEKVTPQPTEEDLLAVAKGAASPTTLGYKENYWVDKTKTTKDFIHFRREVRRGIHRIIKYMGRNENWKWQDDEQLKQLYEIIDNQLNANAGLRWNNFSGKWDVHPKQATQIIIKEHWVREGGGFDVDLGYHYPHAFTAKEL